MIARVARCAIAGLACSAFSMYAQRLSVTLPDHDLWLRLFAVAVRIEKLPSLPWQEGADSGSESSARPLHCRSRALNSPLGDAFLPGPQL
jgi:hypothetical protein